ncbi:hypothetical protein Trydic_g969 [Trypoxylus dichotomus]
MLLENGSEYLKLQDQKCWVKIPNRRCPQPLRNAKKDGKDKPVNQVYLCENEVMRALRRGLCLCAKNYNWYKNWKLRCNYVNENRIVDTDLTKIFKESMNVPSIAPKSFSEPLCLRVE